MDKVKVGLVGGRFGSAFPFHKHPHGMLQAVCDLREDRRQSLQQSTGVSRAYANYEDLLNDETVDAVALFTPAPLHAPMAVKALRAGKHVLSAVPAATSLEECAALVKAVEETGKTYMMAETSYYYPGVMAARRWQQEGRFGTIFYAEAEYLHDIGELRLEDPASLAPMYRLIHDENMGRTWRWGFPPMHYITHSSSGIISVTGERFSAVSALGWADPKDPRVRPMVEDNPYQNPFNNSVALFKTSDGHAARVAELHWLASPSTVRFEYYGTERSFVNPPPGQLEKYWLYNAKEKAEEWKVDPQLDALPAELRPPEGKLAGHAGAEPHIVHEFISAIREQRWPAVNVYEAVAYTAPGICAHQSALHDGEWTIIPDYGRAPK